MQRNTGEEAVAAWNERYNPCFSGSSSATKAAVAAARAAAAVTILVFLAALVQHKQCRNSLRCGD